MTPAPLQVGQAPSEFALNSAGFTPFAFANALRIGSSNPVYVAGLLRREPRIGVWSIRAIHLSRLHWCDAVPRLAGWCPVPAFAGRVPVMVRHGRGLLGLSGVAALAGRVRLPAM